VIKKLFNAIVLVLAINFLAVAGTVGWLFQSGKIDREKLAAIRELVMATDAPPEVVATQPATQPAPQNSLVKLDELLSRYAGRGTGEQVELIQQAVDAQAVALDRRSRELDDLMQQVLREKEELARRNSTLEEDRRQLAAKERQQLADASDKGFQDSLKLYMAMPGKQAKTALMAMPDETVVRYLQAMPPRSASKIIREFKAPAEQVRITALLDLMRQGGPAPATQPTLDVDDGPADAQPPRPASAAANAPTE